MTDISYLQRTFFILYFLSMAGPEYLDKNNFEFHYNREERLAKATKGVRERTLHPDKKVGLFKKNKSLLIILVDILIVIIFGAVLYPFLTNMAQNQEHEGYKFSIRGIVYDGAVLASLKVEKKKALDDGPEMVKIRFFTSENNSGDEIEAAFPSEIGETVIVRDTLAFDGEVSAVKAEIILGDKKHILETPLTEE